MWEVYYEVDEKTKDGWKNLTTRDGITPGRFSARGLSFFLNSAEAQDKEFSVRTIQYGGRRRKYEKAAV